MLTVYRRVAPNQFLKAIELACNPMFLVYVDDDGTMRFGGVNSEHQRLTGITTGVIAGKKPSEILPPRLAHTVETNYRRCLTTGRRVTYEECLDLPAGRRWWQTTLRPISDERGTFAILGSSFDITQRKAEVAELAGEAHIRDLATPDVAAADHALRGPLDTIISLANSLIGPGARRSDPDLVLSVLLQTATSALAGLDHAAEITAQTRDAERHVLIDFGHVCRDFSALADPGGQLDIAFPEIAVLASPRPLEIILNALFEESSRNTASRLRVTLGPDPAAGMGHLRLGFAFDTLDRHNIDTRRLASLAEKFDYTFSDEISDRERRLSMTLPGRTVLHAPDPGCIPPQCASCPSFRVEHPPPFSLLEALDHASD